MSNSEKKLSTPKIKTRAEFRAAKNLLGEILKVHYAPKKGESNVERCIRYYDNNFWQLAHMAITMIDILDELEAFDGREVEAVFERFSDSEKVIRYFCGYAWDYQSKDIYFYCTTTHDLSYCRFNANAAAVLHLTH